MAPKIIDQTTYSFPNQTVTFTIIELQETVRINGEKIKNTHRYWVPAGDNLADAENYVEPLTNPEENLDSDYQLYRRQFNLLMPQEIRQAREALGLSRATTALLLNLSEPQFSAIEDDDLLQTRKQDAKLRLLKNPQELRTSVTRYQKTIERQATRYQVDLSDLNRLLSPNALS